MSENKSEPSREARCELCGEPMPAGEEMFKYHGYSGPCPKPPLPRPESSREVTAKVANMAAETMRQVLRAQREIQGGYMAKEPSALIRDFGLECATLASAPPDAIKESEMKKDEIGGKLRDIQDEIIRTLIGITETLDPKNSNSSYYKEAIMANLNRANREVFAAAENIKFYENADSKEYKKVSEK